MPDNNTNNASLRRFSFVFYAGRNQIAEWLAIKGEAY
jgi:hypothetical protein